MRFLSLNTAESVARTLYDGLLSGRVVLRADLPRTRKKAILPNLEMLKSRFQTLRLMQAIGGVLLLAMICAHTFVALRWLELFHQPGAWPIFAVDVLALSVFGIQVVVMLKEIGHIRELEESENRLVEERDKVESEIRRFKI